MDHCDVKIIEDESDVDRSIDKMSKVNEIVKKRTITLDDILSSWNSLNIPYYIKLLNFNRQQGLCDTDSISHFYRMPALVDLPITLISSELFTEIFDDTIPIVGQSEQSLIKKFYMKKSIIFQSGMFNNTSRQLKSSSFGTSPTRISEFTGSFVMEGDALSCTNSTNSNISNSSPFSAVSKKGIIYCVQKNGSLSFLFKEGEDSTIYIANSRKIDSSADIALDYLYIFHRLKGNKSHDYVGKMTVLNHLLLNPNMSRLVETEFVLFGAEENTMEPQGASSSMEKSKGFTTKIPNIFRSNHSRNKSIINIDHPNIQLEAYLQEFDNSEFEDHIKRGFEPYLESMAIVVKRSSSRSSEKKVENGGWGLKFLEKVTTDCIHSCTEDSETNINVLISSGFHGCPTKGGKGPSTLIERWKSNGSCDCGGWDVGCPITELKNECSVLERVGTENCSCSQENCKIVNLFKKGSKCVEHPAWKITNTGENVYTMYYRPSLSALEAFSIGLATIHTQMPSQNVL